LGLAFHATPATLVRNVNSSDDLALELIVENELDQEQELDQIHQTIGLPFSEDGARIHVPEPELDLVGVDVSRTVTQAKRSLTLSGDGADETGEGYGTVAKRPKGNDAVRESVTICALRYAY
jgi:hypothetical protein